MRVRVPPSPSFQLNAFRRHVLRVFIARPKLECKNKEQQRLLFPEQLSLFLDTPASILFSSTYKRKGVVKCSRNLKRKASSVALTTDEAVQPNAIAHVEAETTSIVQQSLDRSKRRTMDIRQAKGLEIVANSEIIREGNIWLVPSQTSSKVYTTDLALQTCTCADFEATRNKCKHLYAVEFLLQKESNLQLPPSQKTSRPTYKQQWHQYNLSQTREAGYFKSLLYELCTTIEEPIKPKGRGRPTAPLSDLIYAACLKTYNCRSGRRNQSELDEAVRHGFLSRPMRYNTVFKYLELEVMTPLLQQLITESSRVLKNVEEDFAVDSTGFGTCQYKRWFDVKYGNTEDWHDWIKLHLMTGIKTNIVTSCEVSRRYEHDSPYFKPLVSATAANGFTISEVSGDKAYSSRPNLRLVKSLGGTPYIAFKDNSRGNSKCKVWNQMFHYYALNQAEYMRHYHKRSNVESTNAMIKARFGGKLMSKTERAQINEALCKVVCHNICVVIQSMHELGIEVEFIGSL